MMKNYDDEVLESFDEVSEGDVLTVRPDLSTHEEYRVAVVPKMAELAGKPVVVTYVEHNRDYDGFPNDEYVHIGELSDCFWTPDLFLGYHREEIDTSSMPDIDELFG